MHAVVAVVSNKSFPHSRQLVGDISPSTLGSGGNVAVAAVVAALSTGDLLAFMDWGGASPDATLHAVWSRLCRRGLHGMLDLLYDRDPSSSSCSFSSASSISSS
ncbi:hypothetical protein PR202_ga29850 [Eleusine coracana subsp. coracana]|uniref:Uncharacterized protein n=1 Tax=Eleusine coracana subsp. coracana TaxID=191504 RepID=A0AAV5DMT8_ELECO|nr:hypothetical protein PR202_ga29850 [Eleusine coracana subsp. coracana]